MQTVTTTDIQRNFPKILNKLEDPVAVMRDSRPEAVVMTYEDYLDFVALKRRMMADKVRAALAPIHSQTEKIPEKEFDVLVEEALHAAGRN